MDTMMMAVMAHRVVDRWCFGGRFECLVGVCVCEGVGMCVCDGVDGVGRGGLWGCCVVGC